MPNLDVNKLKKELDGIEKLAKQKNQVSEYTDFLGFVKTLIVQFGIYGSKNKDGLDVPEFNQVVKDGLLNTIGVVLDKIDEMLNHEASSNRDFNPDPNVQGILIDTTSDHLNNIKDMLLSDIEYLSDIQSVTGESLLDYQRYESARAMQESFETLLKQIKDVDPRLVKSSKDFKGVKSGLENLVKLTQSVTRPMSEDAYNHMLEKAQDVVDMSELYIAEKKVNPGKSQLAASRLAAMKNVFSAMKTNVKTMHNTLGSKARTNGQVAKAMLIDSKNKIDNQLNQKNINLAIIKNALAEQKYAEQLGKLNSNQVFNRQMAQRAVEQIKKTPELNNNLNAKVASMKAERYKQNAIATMNSYEHYGDYKSLFDKKYIDSETGALKDTYTNIAKNSALKMSSTRTAYNMMVFCHLLKQGNSIQDVFDPNKLQTEKLQAGEDIMDLFQNADVQTLANVTADYAIDGLKITLDEISKRTSKMKSVDPSEFCTSENRFMAAGFAFFQDLGQEIARPMIMNSAEQLIGKKALEDLIRKQSGVGLILKSIGEGPIQAAMMTQGYTVSNSLDRIQSNPKKIMGSIKQDCLNLVESQVVAKLIEDNMVNGQLDIFGSFSMPDKANANRNQENLKVARVHTSIACEQEEIAAIFGECLNKNFNASMKLLSDRFFEGNLINKENIASISVEDGVKFTNLSEFSKLPNSIPLKDPVKEQVL